jgi:hypothetical protein
MSLPSYKICITCGKHIFDNVIVYNKGIFCGEECKNEDINRSNIHRSTIDYFQNYVPHTLMMSSINGRDF